jgi:PAS domain-containing protein
VAALRSLKEHINRGLLAVMLLAFVVTALFVARLRYVDGQHEVVRILTAQSRIAESLIPALLLAHDNRFQGLARTLADRDDQTALAAIRTESRQRDPFDVGYVLDLDGRIVQISDEYVNYLGFNPSHMDHVKGDRKVSRVYQSVFSKRPVIALKYRLNQNLLFIYERDVSNILPALLHLAKGKIL